MTSLTDSLIAFCLGASPDAPDLSGILNDPDRAGLVAALALHHPGALLPLVGDEVLGALNGDPHVASLALALATEDPRAAHAIDDGLDTDDGAAPILEALARTEQPWEHPRLIDHLDEPSTADAAALVLADTSPELLIERLETLDDPHQVERSFRALGLRGAPDLFGPLAALRDLFAESLEPEQRDRLDACLATLDPDAYARAALRGDLEVTWLNDDRSVADFLTRHGTTTWLTTLALSRTARDPQGFSLAASLAVAAAFTDPVDELPDDELDPALAQELLAQQPRRLALPLALADEEHLIELLAQATFHEALTRRGLTPPPIAGLPLSGPPLDLDDIEASLDFLADADLDEPGPRIALLRTIADLHQHLLDEEVPATEARRLIHHFGASIPRGKKLVTTLLSGEALAGPSDWGCRGLHRLTSLLHTPATSALPALAQALWTGPIFRVPVADALIAAFLEPVPREP